MHKNFLFDKMTILSSDDRSFLTHRLPMAMAAKKSCREVWVICRDTGECEEISQFGFEVVALPVGKRPLNIFANLILLYKLVSIYKKINPDLIYHSSVQMSFIGSMACLFIRDFKSINSITGVGYLFSSDKLKAKFLRLVLSPCLQILWKRLNTVMLFQNPDDRDIFVDKGLCKANAPLIPGSGVDDKKFIPVVIKPNLKQTERPIVFGCASRLIEDKGIAELLDSIKIVEKSHPIELRIAGDIYPNNPSSFTSEEIAHWSKMDSVNFLGDVSDMLEFWQNCDVAILPSHREGFPKALLEAAACGLPLLGTDVPGIREIIVNGHNGLLFAKADSQDIARSIKRMIIDHEFRWTAGRASLEVIKSRGLSNIDVEISFIKLFASIKIHADSASDK